MSSKTIYKNFFFLFISNLEKFPEINSSQDGEGDRKANSDQRSSDLSVSFEINIELVVFLHDVPRLTRLVLVREGDGGDLDLQELAESLPALAHPVHQEAGAWHHGLHCRVVSPVLVLPHTLVEGKIDKLQQFINIKGVPTKIQKIDEEN